MNINATLIGQSIAFIVFIWFCMKYVWPPIINALEQRKRKIADGILFSEEAAKKLAQASEDALKQRSEAQQQAKEIINEANQQAAYLIDEARQRAKEESSRLLAAAQGQIEQEVMQARGALKKQLSSLVVAGATSIIGERMDEAVNNKLLNQLADQL